MNGFIHTDFLPNVMQEAGSSCAAADIPSVFPVCLRISQLRGLVFTLQSTQGLQQQEDDRISWEEFLSFILLGHLSGNIVVQDTAMPHSDTGLLERPQAAYLVSTALAPRWNGAACIRFYQHE